MSKSFKQRIKLPALPKQVFETLLDSRKHTGFTGAPAFCSKREGSEFSAYNGMLTGRNVELVNNKRIVQAWRAKNWPKGVYSIVSYTLTKTPDNKCSLEFNHIGIPDSELEKIKKGWDAHYWQPLKQYLKEKSSPGNKTSKTKATTKTKINSKKKTTSRKKAKRAA